MLGQFEPLLIPTEQFSFSKEEVQYINKYYCVRKYKYWWEGRLVAPNTTIVLLKSDAGKFKKSEKVKKFIIELRTKKFKTLQQASSYIETFLNSILDDVKPGTIHAYNNSAVAINSFYQPFSNPLYFYKVSHKWLIANEISQKINKNKIITFGSKPQALRYLHNYISYNLYELYANFIEQYSIEAYLNPKILHPDVYVMNKELYDSWWMFFVQPEIQLNTIF